MSSFIPSSKSGIINMIFQNNYNQIMEVRPSCSAYHSKFVTNFCSRKLLFWDLKLNFQRKPCKINKKILIYFLINPTIQMWSTHWNFNFPSYIQNDFYDSSNILWLIFETIDGMGRQRDNASNSQVWTGASIFLVTYKLPYATIKFSSILNYFSQTMWIFAKIQWIFLKILFFNLEIRVL